MGPKERSQPTVSRRGAHFSHRKGYVSLEDYTSFLIDKESENIKSSDEIENAFQALAEGKAYITKEDMKQVRFRLRPLSLCSHGNPSMLLLGLTVYH